MADADRDTPRVVINIDDVGMCHGANQAFLTLRRAGAVDSGSVMVPCPWFREIAEIGADDPSLNLGIHITLTSEKRFYRWRPLIGVSRASGLLDEEGFMWRRAQDLRAHGDPAAVEDEMRAQIEAFLATGVKPSHLDGHMGSVFAPEFAERYVSLGLEYGIPTLFPVTVAAYVPNHNLGAVDEAAVAVASSRLAAAGNALADRVLETPWNRDHPPAERYRAVFAQVGPGLTFVCLHANSPCELELIEPGSAQIRIDEFVLLQDPGFRAWLDGLGFNRGSLSDHLAALRA